jgi:hypothetical protein
MNQLSSTRYIHLKHFLSVLELKARISHSWRWGRIEDLVETCWVHGVSKSASSITKTTALQDHRRELLVEQIFFERPGGTNISS